MQELSPLGNCIGKLEIRVAGSLSTTNTEDEMNLTMEILGKFGEASGLHTNLQKSCVIPIRCEQPVADNVNFILPCTAAQLPCTWDDRKLRKSDLLPWTDKVTDKLPGWQAALMNTAGHITWVRFVFQ